MTHCPSIPRLLESRAAELSDRPVIVAAKLQPLSYRQLFIQTEEVVQRLNALGIGRSDRVAAILPNGPEMAAAFLTISSAAAFAPLNPGYHANEFEFFLSDLKPAALVVAAGSASPGIAVARDHSIPLIELAPVGNRRAGGFALRGQDQPSRESRAGFAETNDVALILHTSGTTSRAKMVPLTHSNLLASASNIAAGLQLGEEDRCLNIMPLFHIHGLIGAVLSSIVAGSSVVCTPEFGAPEFLNLLETFLPTWYAAVPTMHRAVIEHAKAIPRKISHSLRPHSRRQFDRDAWKLPSAIDQRGERGWRIPRDHQRSALRVDAGRSGGAGRGVDSAPHKRCQDGVRSHFSQGNLPGEKLRRSRRRAQPRAGPTERRHRQSRSHARPLRVLNARRQRTLQ